MDADRSSERPEPGSRTRRHRVAGASRRVAAASARAGRATGRVTSRVAAGTGRRVQAATHAQGAGESGLAKVIEMHGVAAAGDALVLLALADTVFFSVPIGEARSRVALYLLVTMLPFAVMAPVLGPVLDRFRHGRRYALATTLVARAFLAWVLAGAVAGESEGFALYPAAFGHLVASKAYGVTRAAATPRVLPRGLSLVTANSRVMLGGVVAVAVAVPLGAAVLRLLGNEWTLRLAFVVFVVGTVLALRLPARVDSSAGEVSARLSSHDERVLPPPSRTEPVVAGATGPTGQPGGSGASGGTGSAGAATGTTGAPPGVPSWVGRRWAIGPRVFLGLRAVAALRAFTGFLTLYLAFALREEPLFETPKPIVVIGLVATCAGLGNTLGTSLGALLRRLTPEVTVAGMVALAGLGATFGAAFYGLPALLAAGLCAGLAGALGKLSLDALVQREVPDAVRTSAFARAETVLQVAWVLGGGVGTVLPLAGPWGLGLAAVALVGVLVVTVHAHATTRRTTAA